MAEGYELRYFARKWKITTAEAVSLIRRFGKDRAKLNQAALDLTRQKQATRRK